MAIAFARISYHSRSQGHSAVAGAAYRAGEVLLDERTGEVHSFKNRDDVVYSKILLPEGADPKFNDRKTLWNAVEAAENRSNSQVAKDIVLALPHGLDLSHHIDLAHNFADYHFVQNGVVADVAIHDHGDGNPHAHIYVTTRRLHGSQFDKYKARDLEPNVVRGRVVDPQFWGEQWREMQNGYFKDHDIDLLVDANHIVSQRHEGKVRGKEKHYIKEENKLRREASIEIARNDPTSLLNLLGSKHAVFSDRDIAMLIHKNTERPEDYQAAMRGLLRHKDLILLGHGDDGRNRYTTQANYKREAKMADQALALSANYRHSAPAAITKTYTKKYNLNDEQQSALTHIATSGDLCAIVGRAGTGKSYMMKAANQMWSNMGFNVRGIAVSGIAAKGLEADAGIPSRTIYSLKMQLAMGSVKLSNNDVIIMDEAGMTDLNDMALIIWAAKDAGAKLVLVGDHAQLQPVGPGAPFRALVEQIGFAELNKIQRQKDPEDCRASRLLSLGSIGGALKHYHAKNQIHFVEEHNQPITGNDEDSDDSGGSAAISRLVGDWSKNLTKDNLNNRMILAHRNIDVKALNESARDAMKQHNLLGKKETAVSTKNGEIVLSEGDRIIFLKNNKRELGVSNGEFATVTKISEKNISVSLNRKADKNLTFSTKDYNHFNYGYAATVHKSQGVTVDNTFVYVAGRAWNKFLAYVSMTRHRNSLNVYASANQYKDIADLNRTLSRSSIKDSVLDWPLSYAIRRGFDPESMLGRFIDKVVGAKQTIRDKWLYASNYAIFKQKENHQQSLASKEHNRNMAKNAAYFVDLRNDIGAQARAMRQDLKPNEKLHNHHDYTQWYERTLYRDKLAFDINKDAPKYEKALELNRISKKVLEGYASNYERYLAVESYVRGANQSDRSSLYPIAEKIHRDLAKHYPAIAYLVKSSRTEPHLIAKQISEDARAAEHQRATQTPNHQESQDVTQAPPTRTQIHSNDTEWDKLSEIKSKDFDEVIKYKALYDKAEDSMERNIYKNAYEKSVKDIVSTDKVFNQIKETMPNLTQEFNRIAHGNKPIAINWLSSDLNTEFEVLKKSNNDDFQSLAKLRDILCRDKGSPDKLVTAQLESLALQILRHPPSSEKLKSTSPNLFIKFQQVKINRERDRGIDR